MGRSRVGLVGGLGGGCAVAVWALVMTGGIAGWAGGKSKPTLPQAVLTAHTVAVLVYPSAGISIENPQANQVAQKDVETALERWGRYQPVMGAEQADLLIVVRRGHGKLADETIGDPRQNDRAGVINPRDGGIGVGAQHGQQPPVATGSGPLGSEDGRGPGARPQAEIGQAEDEFAVYLGAREQPPLDAPPVWRWVRKDGLRAHDVPAVEEFRRAVAEADKAAAAQQQGGSGKKP